MVVAFCTKQVSSERLLIRSISRGIKLAQLGAIATRGKGEGNITKSCFVSGERSDNVRNCKASAEEESEIEERLSRTLIHALATAKLLV